MANYLMYADLTATVLQGISAFKVQREQSKMGRAIQKHQEVMRGLSAALTKNNITQNEVETMRANVFADLGIQTQAAADQAEARAAAAAAGVAGNTVDDTMNVLRRSAANAQAARGVSLAQAMRAHGQQRQETNLQMIYGRDTTVLPKPNIGAHLLGLSQQLVDTYDAHQPAGHKSTDRLSSLLEK